MFYILSIIIYCVVFLPQVFVTSICLVYLTCLVTSENMTTQIWVTSLLDDIRKASAASRAGPTEYYGGLRACPDHLINIMILGHLCISAIIGNI